MTDPEYLLFLKKLYDHLLDGKSELAAIVLKREIEKREKVKEDSAASKAP